MRKIEIVNIPCLGLLSTSIDALAKERQLESETMAILRDEISRVIPPFGLIFRMIKVIAGKLKVISGQSTLVLRSREYRACGENGEKQQPILHASLQADPTARQLSPDKGQKEW